MTSPEALNMHASYPIYCGEEAIANLIEYCQDHQLSRFLLVSDHNTHAALGQRAEAALREQNWDVRTVILAGGEVIADESRILEVLFHANGEARTYVAVGSGTVTDITRYASHCARNAFISLPTAPSVDAYASAGAALVVRGSFQHKGEQSGFKKTVPGQAPAAIFADLETLCQAPRDMIAAGFGDVLGKYISLADWQLGRLLLGEPYDAGVARRLRMALRSCVENVREIGQASRTGTRALMEALFESGLCMAEFGSSRPASGAEHIISHFWEMKGMQEQRPAILHGAKVGLGTILAARRYEAVRGLTEQDAIDRLPAASLPAQSDEIARIRTAYGAAADQIIADHRPFLEMLETRFDALKHEIGTHWADIQEITASVPPAGRIAELLEQAGGPTAPGAVGLSEEDVRQALTFSRYLRARFTVNTLGRILGLW